MKVRLTLTLVLAAILAAWPSPATAETTDFPPGFEGYHTYAEVGDVLAAAEATFGQGTGAILKRYTLGQSFEGRDIWAVKISDRVASDEAEPEVLAESAMHAREHLTVEMSLYMIDLLTTNYGKTDALGIRVTQLVNTREIWVIPMLNPDGAEYDHLDGVWHGWRKNRQTIPGSDAIGIDLNRNWGYMWACCGGSSTKPGSPQFRGQFPFQAVENVVLRNFILSRRVDGVQQIKAIFNWHTTGEFVLWPYGFTKDDVPPQMTHDDHGAFVTIGQRIAELSGYYPRQGSDSYIYDGDFPAWAYGHQRIFIYTIEMYPSLTCGTCGGFHPPDSVIQREVVRNTEMVLYFLEQADCVYRAAGLGATHCGPINDDFETARGWKFGGTTSGRWARGVPAETTDGAELMQTASVSSGMAALVTGADSGADAAANDVDGSTWARSRLFRANDRTTVRFSYTFAHDAGSSSADFVRLTVIRGTTRTVVWSQSGNDAARAAAWETVDVSLSEFAGTKVRLLFQATDGDTDNLVEAAIDDVRVFTTP